MFEPEKEFMKKGYLTLCKYTGGTASEQETESFLERTFWVKVIRESDAYTSLRMSGKKIDRYFRVEGIENLKSVIGDKRPAIILTGHFGSFFIPAIAFTHLGYDVYPIARTVDTSPATPLPTQYYLKLNYWLSEMRFSSRYIYTNFSGKIDREVVSIGRRGGIFWAAIDLPRRLYHYKRLPVTFFGRQSSLPGGIIPWGIKRGAVFLTAWNSIEGIDSGNFYRLLTIDGMIPEGLDTGEILQIYSDRLAERVSMQPWEWLPIQVIDQFDESEGRNG
ncbi:MAG TPA: hypothetical protein VFG09_14185 [Thermodesulfovibrionales bacterium]|nr:hypothetical protein [Thermodesulfovibrionales bacterium]